MASNNRNKSAEPKPVGDVNQPLGGNDPFYEQNAKDRDYSPADEERKAAQERDVEPVAPTPKPETRDLGTSAKITLFGHPDTWLVEANGEEFTYQGSVHTYLTENGVTDIEDITEYTDTGESST